MTTSESPPSRPPFSVAMLALVIAGEAIFFLPFVIARVFRPTLLEVFGISNLELGLAFAAYGVVAMLAYFPGGPLADAFAARKLMMIALLSTPLGGGRGLVAAASGTIAVLIYSFLLRGDLASATLAERTHAFQLVILVFAGFTCASAVLVWYALRAGESPSAEVEPRITFSGAMAVLKMPAVALQAVIIVCAYVGYKGLDDLSLYAKEVLGYDEVTAAHTSTVSMWVRPVAAIVAGIVADRSRISWITAVSFLVMAVGAGAIATGVFKPGMTFAFFSTIIATSAAVFALRGLYFAIMQEGYVPFHYTGTAVGVVSAIGYTPDVFMGPLMGKLLDDSPGALGHQHLFAVVALFALIGLVASLCFRWVANRQSDELARCSLQ